MQAKENVISHTCECHLPMNQGNLVNNTCGPKQLLKIRGRHLHADTEQRRAKKADECEASVVMQEVRDREIEHL